MVLCAAAAALTLPAIAAADRPYTVRFTANAQGDITGTANTLMTCDESTDARCPAARNGQGGSANNNNGVAMRYVDVDADPRTFDSSAATLSLPTGARILFAGLYYSGRLQAGTGGHGAPSPLQRNQVLLRPPNLGDYLPLTASVVDDAPVAGPQTFRLYQGFVDVTDIVRAAGPGEYTVANVQLGTGLDPDQSGGWALAVAYEDTNQPTRNLTIFDGFQFVTADSLPVDIPLSGFVTPRSGPVSTRIGFVTTEGDLGTTGDSATINAGLPNSRVLSNAANPANNFFNASISTRNGVPLETKRPNDLNQFGFDADVIDATGLLANGQSATTIRLATSGDGFAPQVVSFATDLFAPSLRVVKAVDREQAELGDVLTYTVAVSNVGLDAATNVTLRDAIPAGTTYLPGSLAIDGAGKTDAAGDDTAEFDATARTVVMRLGAGANASNGGRIPVGAPATTIRFQVRVDDALDLGYVVRNNATVSDVSETLGQPGATTSPDVLTRILVPDLAMAKSHTGEFVAGRTVPFTLGVTNVGEASTHGPVTVTDRLDDVMTFVVAPAGDGWACTTAGRLLTCTRSDPLAPGNAYPPIRYTARVAAGAAPATLLNTATVTTPGDGNPTNDSASDGGESRPPSIDLAISKVALTPRAFPGDEVRFRLRVTNRGPDTATRVVVRDLLPRGLTLVSAVPSRGTCTGAVCRLGRMRAGGAAHIDLTALAAPDTGGRVLVDRAVVTGRETDNNPANNADRAAVLIIPLVDIVVEKSTAAPQVEAGGDATFLVVVSNDGPSDATGVVVRDVLPAELVPISATPTQGSCETPTACTLGDLAAGASAQIVVVGRADPSLVGRTLTNTAVALAAEPDRDLANNLDSATVTVVAPPPLPADVVVTKTASAAIVSVGDTFSYTVTARNRGPGTADSVAVTDTPDPGLELVSAVPSQGTCSAGVPVRCDLGALAPGASATVLVNVRALAAGSVRNGVTVITSTPTTPTPPPARIAVAGAIAQSGPRVGLRKQASRHVVRSRGTVTFRLTATARGSGTARDVEICDRMPRGFTVISAGGARLTDGRWCTRIAALAAGTSKTVRIVARAPSVTAARSTTNAATLAFGDQAPRFAVARVVVVPPRAPFTG